VCRCSAQLALNGAALVITGFFGMWSALSLRLQDAIISCYVLLFGLMLVAFSFSKENAFLVRYFNFIYLPRGQLFFLVGTAHLHVCTAIPRPW
jgi:hypothetical protein